MNRKKLIGLVAIALIASLIATTAVQAQDGLPSPSYDVYGYVLYTDNGTAVSGAIVNLTNTRTGEVLVNTTDSLGRFQFYLSDLTLGYNDSDTLSLYAKLGAYSGANTTTVNMTAGSSRVDVYIKGLTVTTGWGTSYDLYITVAIILVVLLLGVIAFFFIMPRRRLGKRW